MSSNPDQGADPTTAVGRETPDDGATEPDSTEGGTPGGSPAGATAYRSGSGSAAWEAGRPTGPHAPPIVLGLACLALASLILAQELGSLSVDWGDVGPLGIVAAGAVLVVLGLMGLLSSRRRSGA